LQKMPFPGAVREPKVVLGRDFGAELRKHYGIEYIAPVDARSLPGLADASIDLIGTTYCREHIPEDVLRAIVREFVRVSHKDTLVSMLVDYCDHNCHLDRGITAYNFLRFSEEEWRPYNVESRFQNRLRHSDYRKMFLEAGFAMLDESADTPPDALEQIARTPLHEDFKKYEQADLLTLIGHFVMRHPDRPEKARAAA
ncbi:MAG: class I SAM-dependent methyltransferase, partial [Candidatus Methylomirabilis sp.]|nr:class I SAM-dependent methyltransferase [Deltaproteobacteria bacterium]